jgi:hypothetical protein
MRHMYAVAVGRPSSGISAMSRDMSVKSAMSTMRVKAAKTRAMTFSAAPVRDRDEVGVELPVG